MKILAFGEILWDIFGEEKKIGGAPFNFAAHSAKLGADGYLYTAVGLDENGDDAIAEMKRLGIKTDHVHRDRKYKTGVCNVTLSNGKPKYELALNTAYDRIPYMTVNGGFDALYMGTLAMRSSESARTFDKIMKYVERKETFFDVNFRANFYSRELVERLLKESTILKVSDEELGFFGRTDLLQTCIFIAKNHPRLKYICITLGPDGAIVYDCRNKRVYCSEKPKGRVVSTVGAGDSFSAAFLVNLLSGKPIEVCLDRAVALSDFVVTRLEAVPDYDQLDFFGK